MPPPRGGELARREVDQIGQTRHHADDLAHRVLLPLLLALFDQVGVLAQKARVEYQHDVVFVGHAPHVHHVGQREGLSADKVRRGLHADEGDIIHAVLLDAAFELLDVDVALEGVVRLELEGVVTQQLGYLATVFEDVGQRRGEVVVHRDNVARLDEGTADDVLGGASLMHRQQVFLAQDILYGLLQALERLRARIGVVGTHHGGKLVVAHGVGAAVGEHVEVDVARTQTEGVESRLIHGVETAFDGYEVELLHYTHLVQLQRQVSASVEFYLAHSR